MFKRVISMFLIVAAVGLGTLLTGRDTARAQDSPRLDERTQAALVAALEDERRAEAFYQAIIDGMGPVRPFSNIVRAERQHQAELLLLFDAYDVPVPARRDWRFQVPATRTQACELGAQSELDNIAMYDELLAQVAEPDIRATFTRLQDASRYRHLPAFQRCARRAGPRW